MTDALRLARAVRELLATPDRWTQGAWALAADGSECPPGDGKAVCWCINGALGRLAPEFPKSRNFVRQKILALTSNRFVAAWNDTPGRTHADVLALLDRVIAEMEAEGG